MEWFEWAFILPISGWLIREVLTNISQTNFMRKQSENEHKYYKKRLIFEQKNEIYKELYKRLKHMIGVMNDFNFFDERIMNTHQEAIDRYVSSTRFDEEKVEADEFLNLYITEESTRFKVNMYYNFELLEKYYMNFKNYVSEQNYILTKDENEILLKIDASRNKINSYIVESINYTNDEEEVMQKARNHFGEEFQKRFNEIDQLTYEFSDTIRKEMFL